MVAIVTGSGLGLAGASSSVLGLGGQVGSAAAGQGGEAVYVNAATGALIVQHEDELLAGRGPDLGVVRTYNSNATFDFDNNDSWQLSLYRQLSSLTGTVNTAGSTVVRTGADGAQLTYTYDTARGAYVSTAGAGATDTLAYDSATDTWTWTDGDTRVSETYAASPSAGQWRITGLADLDGNALTYAYDAAGLITQVTDANGETTRLVYDPATRQLQSLQVVTADGLATTRVRYTYDAQGRLATVITDLTPADGQISDGAIYTTTYTYDGTSARIAAIVNSDGTRVGFTYDALGRVASLIDGANQVTTFTYGAGSTTVSLGQPTGGKGGGSILVQASTLTYGSAGQLTRLQDSSGQDIAYAYNAAGNLVQLTDSRGATVTYTYDANGNCLRQQDSAGNVVERAYNRANQLLSETRYTVPDPDGSGPGQASGPQTTYYVRDAQQHLRFTVSPEGRVSETRYNGAGQAVASLVYPAGTFAVGTAAPSEADLVAWAAAQDLTRIERTDTAYDARGLATSVTRYAKTNATGAGVADGTQSTTQYVYDAAGRLLQQIDPRGVATTGVANDYVTSYAYDGLGRTISVTSTDAAGSARQTTTVFNDALNRIELTLANGLKRVSTFDARGLLTSQVDQDGATALSTQTYLYDGAGRLRVVTDPKGAKTYRCYDAAGRVVGEIDAAGALTEFVYNGNGQVTKTIRYATAVTANLASLFALNANGVTANVQLASVRPASTANDPIERRIYDAAGRLCFTIDAAGFVTETRYDGSGRVLTTIAYAHALNNAAGLDSLGREASPADLQLLTTAPAGNTIGLLLDPSADRVSRAFYDADGRLTGTLDGEGYLTAFQYDGAGQLIQTTRYAATTAPALRAAGSLADLVASANAAPAQNITSYAYYNGLGQTIGNIDGEGYYTAYAYDLAGNRTRTTRYANRLVGTPVPGTPPQVAGAAPGTVPAGGYVLTSAQDQATQATWTAANQLETETAADGTLTRSTYDALGNLLSTVTAAGAPDSRTRLARYDLQGRLIQALSAAGAQALAALGTNPSTVQVEAVWAAYGTAYTYDAAGRRTRQVDANGAVTLYFYDADNRLTFTVVRVRNPANPAEWVGEVTGRQFNALGQVTAETGYATRLSAAAFATLTGGAESQVQAVLVADAIHDRHTDYTYLLTGQLSRSTIQLNTTQTALAEAFYNAFGEMSARQTSLDASLIRREEFAYDRRGGLTEDRKDVAWSGNPTATGVTTRTTYDAFGRAVSTTDGNGIISTATYDRLGRQIQTVTAAGSLNLTRSTTYDAFGRVLTHTDALRQTTTYAYTTDPASGEATLTVTSPEGIVTKAVTDRYGQTLTVVDGQGNETRYAYDADGNLTSTTRWDKLANTETRVETDTYDAVGHLLTTRDANGHTVAYSYDAAGRVLTRTVDPGGLNLVTRTEYDALGRAVQVTDPAGTVTRTTYDAAGRILEVAVDPSGLNLLTRYTYDLSGQVLTVVEGAGTPEARTTAYTYDSRGRRTQTVVDPAGLNLQTRYVFDNNDNAVEKIDAADGVTRYVYDSDNRLVYTIDPAGGVSKNEYDAEGRVVKTISYANAISQTGLGSSLSEADVTTRLSVNPSTDHVIRTVYDRDGRAVYLIDSLNQVTQRAYDKNGNVIRTTAYALPITLPADLTLTNIAAAVAATASSAGDRVTQTVYDAANRSIFVIDALGYVCETKYDAGNHIIETVRYAKPAVLTGQATETAVRAALSTNDADQHVSFVYDAAGRLISSTDAEGFTEAYTYDAVGNKIQFTNKRGATWTYAYDSNRRMVSERSPLVEVTSVTASLVQTQENANLETRIQYDALGNVLSRTEAYGRPEARTTSYQYDGAGRQVKIIYPQVSVYSASADDLTTNGLNGTVTRTEQLVTPITTVTVDALGRAVVNNDVTGVYSYKVYDALGRVQYEIDGEHYLTEYRYDRFGNQVQTIRYATALVFAFDRATAFTAPEIASLVQVSADDRILTSEYDRLDRLVRVIEPAAFNYDPDAPTQYQYFTAGRQTEKVYNAAGQVIKQRVLKNPNTNTWTETYYYYDRRGDKAAEVDALGYQTTWEYDAAHNVTRQVEYAKAGSWNADKSVYTAPTATTSASTPNSTIGYDRETRYQYDRKNQKIAETRVNVEYATTSGALVVNSTFGDLTTTYAYDGVGNLTRTTDPTGASTYLYYDALGRTVAAAEPARISDSSGGQLVMPPVSVKYDPATNLAKLVFARQVSTDTIVNFKYAVAGSGNWVTVTPQVEGTQYTVALTGLPSDRYDYQILYTRSGDTTAYATGTGQVSVEGPTSVGSVNVAANVERQTFSSKITSSAGASTTANNISLSWNSLAMLGNGNVRVKVSYATMTWTATGDAEYGYSYSPSGTVATSRSQTYSAAQANAGVNFSWNDAALQWTGSNNYAGTAGVSSVSRVEVFKVVDGQEIKVLDSAALVGERLVLRGKTAGLTGINVAGVGTLSVTSLGAGVYTVNLASLKRGTYTYTPVGSASALGGSFEVKASTGNTTAGLQESNGVLQAYNLPSTVSKVSLQYRLAGDSGPYLSSSLTRNSDGTFSTAYDDIGSGVYEVILVATDTSGNPIDLSAVGGAADGTLASTITIKHGGDSLPTVTLAGTGVSQLVPLTVFKRDIYGNVVAEIDYAKGASTVSETSYGAAGVDAANDHTSYSFFDTHGHIVRSVDALGNSVYSSYDALGHVVKTWQPNVDNDGKLQNSVHLYQYDRVGHETANIDLANITARTMSNATTTSTTMAQASVSASVAASAHYYQYVVSYDPEYGYTYGTAFDSSSKINLTWNAMSAWGNGDVRVTVDYKRATGGALQVSQVSQVFASAAANTGVTLSWADSTVAYGISSISRIRVEKKDANGNWVMVHDRPSNGVYGNLLTWNCPTTSNTQGLLRYKSVNSNTWIDAPIIKFGTQFIFSTGSLAAGTYEYELQTQPTGGGVATTYEVGQFTVNGTSGTVKVVKAVASGIALSQATLTTTVAQSAHYYQYVVSYDPEYGYTYDTAFDSANSIKVSWNSMADWGDGDVMVTVDYTRATGGAAQATQTYTAAAAVTGATLSWSDTTAAYGISAISRVRVWKKDVNNQWVLVHDRPSSGAYGNQLVFAAPSDTDISASLRYRLTGTSTWTVATLNNFGKQEWMSVAGFSNGTYEYELLYKASNEYAPSYKASGSFTISGTSASAINPGNLASIPLDPASFTRNEARYNAFGEITAKGINGGWQEYYNYDREGRLWRTNGQDGVARVTLYDLQGHATAEIKSQSLDLSSYADPQSVGALTTNVQRTNNRYDLLGRVVQQTLPSFTVDSGLEVMGTPVAAEGASVTASVSKSAHYYQYVVSYDPEYGYTYGTAFDSASSVSLSWNAMAGWGDGQVRVTVDYTRATGGAAQVIQSFSSAAANTGATVSWNDPTSAYGVKTINRIRVEKQDVNGNWVLVHDRPSSGAYGTILTWNQPTDLFAQTSIRYKLTSSSTWTTSAVSCFGNRISFSATGLAAGTYDYEVLATRQGESTAYAHQTGILTISGASGTVNDTTVVTSNSKTLVSQKNQTLDRWGNVLTIDDPRNSAWQTVSRYNSQNQLIEQKLPTVDVWTANGTSSLTTPTQRAYYDMAGRSIATVDANGNVSTIRYDAAGQVTAEYHADGGVVRYQYDIFGRKIRQIDAVGNSTDYQYDRLDHLVKEKRPIGEVNYSYDAAGNRTRETDALGQTTSYWYDTRGKLIRMRMPLLQETVYSYDARGYKIGEYNGNRDFATWTYDYFGRVLAHADLGGTVTNYTYNKTGQILTQTSSSGQSLAYTYYENGNIKKIVDNGSPNLVLVKGGMVDVVGNAVTKHGVTGWGNAEVSSRDGLTGGAYASATAGQINLGGMFGLNSDPTTDQNYTSLDYAWYPAADGKLYIYESGTSIGSFGTYTTTDVLAVSYDGANIRYLKNGQVIRTVATSANRTFYFDSSFYSAGFKLNNIQFKAPGSETYYEYDAAGNRTRERFIKNGLKAEDVRTSYDTLGRMTLVSDNRYVLTYRYDANGNRRRAQSTYYDENNALKSSDNWYLYDSMNRITLSQGGLVNGSIITNPTPAVVLIAGGSTTISSNSATKTGSTGWGNSDAYSRDGLTGGAYASATAGQTNLYGMFGLNSDPTTDKNYTSLDYAWYPAADGNLYIYESGTSIGSFGPYTTNDVLAVSYDGANIRYLKNGQVMRTVATSANRTFYFDSSFYNTGYKLNNIRFEPNSPQGVAISYDAAGNRRQATRYESGVQVTETYTYDANNRLLNINRSGNLTSSRTYDAAGRVTEQVTYSTPGVVSERRSNTYNANGWLTQQDVTNGAGTLTQRVTYTAYDALGNAKNYQTSVYTGTAYTNYYSYTYAKFDSYKEQKQSGTSTYFQPGATTTVYDVNGNVANVTETFATSKNRSFLTDQSGHILQKTENGKTQNYFFANDKPLGSSGALGAADFDYNYTPVSAQYPGNTPSNYVVSAGDTLRSIALAAFGDAQLWYLIADANGLKTDSDLQVGRNLIIPNKVTNLRNASDTFKPYRAGAIIGDTTPTLPNPPPPPPVSHSGGHGGCGGIGSIIVAIVTIVVAYYTGQYYLAEFGGAQASVGAYVAAGAIGAAAGSVAGQAVGMAIGVQDSFSWRAVGLAAIGGAVAGGLNAIGAFGSGAVGAGLRAAAGNIVTQGIGVVTGLQEKFNWQSVVASAITAGIGQALDDSGIGKSIIRDTGNLGRLGLSTLASTSARMLVYAGKPDWAKVAADSFGNVIANSLAASTRVSSDTLGDFIKANEQNWGMTSTAITGSAAGSVDSVGVGSGNSSASPSYASESLPPRGNTSFLAAPYVETTKPKGGEIWSSGAETFPVPTPRIEVRELAPIDPPTTPQVPSDDSGDIGIDGWNYKPNTYSGQPLVTDLNRDLRKIKDWAQDKAVDAGVYWQQRGGLVGKVGSALSGAGYVGAEILIPGDQKELVALAATPVAGKIIGAGIGILNKVPVLGDTLPQLGERVSTLFGSNVANATNDVATAAVRSEAAANIWQARQILADTRPDLTIAERNQIIKAFDLESFRVNTLNSPVTEFRYFDGLPDGAGMNGRWSTPQWFDTPAERIGNLALPNNQATQAATVTLQPGTTVFQGTVAPQLRFSPDLTGGGLQTYNALGPRATIKVFP